MDLFLYTAEWKGGERDKTVHRGEKGMTFLFKRESNSTVTLLE